MVALQGILPMLSQRDLPAQKVCANQRALPWLERRVASGRQVGAIVCREQVLETSVLYVAAGPRERNTVIKTAVLGPLGGLSLWRV